MNLGSRSLSVRDYSAEIPISAYLISMFIAGLSNFQGWDAGRAERLRSCEEVRKEFRGVFESSGRI